MARKAEILARGRLLYQTERPYTGVNSRRYAAEGSRTPPAYILAEQRFTTGHDDTAGFVEIIDADDRVVRCWKFDYPMVKRFSSPDWYDDDCLIAYLMEEFGLPLVGCRLPESVQ